MFKKTYIILKYIYFYINKYIYMDDKCFYVNNKELIKELELLKENSDKTVKKIIDDEIYNIKNEFQSKRIKRGGTSKICNALTIAVILGGSTGAAFATNYLAKKYVIGRVLAPLCTTKSDQITGYLLSFVNPSSSCLARQKAWDSFRTYILTSVSITSLFHATFHKYKKIYNVLLPYCNYISQGCISSAQFIGNKTKSVYNKINANLGKRTRIEESNESSEIFLTPKSNETRKSSSSKSISSKYSRKSHSSSPIQTKKYNSNMKELYSLRKERSVSKSPKHFEPPSSMVYKTKSLPHNRTKKMNITYKSLKGGKNNTTRK